MIYPFSEACTQPLPISQKLERFLMTIRPEGGGTSVKGELCLQITIARAASHMSLRSNDAKRRRHSE